MKKSTLKIEREYKFRIDLDKLHQALREAKIPVTKIRITQGYLTAQNDSIDIRIRKINDAEYFLTLKEGAGLERLESENRISKKAFEDLWRNVKGRVIEKTRLEFMLKINEKEYVAEADVYEGRHKGLAIMEVEVGEGEVLDIKDLPEWALENVTGKEEYSNRYLACKEISK